MSVIFKGTYFGFLSHLEGKKHVYFSV